MMARTRWLNTDEARAWQGFVMCSQLLFAALDRQLQLDAGMPHSDYQLLVTLSISPERSLRMTRLAASMSYSQSRVSHAVARMESTGWVRRVKDPTDRRGTTAVLTDAGFAVLEAAAPGHVEAVRANLLDQLSTEEISQLAAICAKALAKLTTGLPRHPDQAAGPPEHLPG